MIMETKEKDLNIRLEPMVKETGEQRGRNGFMPKILIVDDVIDNIRLISNILNRHNSTYSIRYATNGDEALEIVNSFTPDLIMLDVVMPGMDGFSVCRTLKENALEFISSYEKFLDNKMREDDIKFSNILEGLNVLTSQSELKAIVIFCQPMHYPVLLNSLKKEKRLQEMGIIICDIDIIRLLNMMKPFTSKNRIMHSNYDIALDITGRKKPQRFEVPEAIIVSS